MKIPQNSKENSWQGFCYEWNRREKVREKNMVTGEADKAVVSVRAVALAGGTSAAARDAANKDSYRTRTIFPIAPSVFSPAVTWT